MAFPGSRCRKNGAAVVCAALACLVVGTLHAAESQQVNKDNGKVRLTAGEQSLLTYLYRPKPYKAYLRRLYTPDGRNVLLDSPDHHRHHHGLMYALQAGDVNFWHEFPDRDPGTQSHASLELLRGDRGPGFQHQLQWQSADGQTIARERRTVRLLRAGDQQNPRLLEWQTRLVPDTEDGSLTLSGHHYYGLGLRFVRDMDGDADFFNSSGEPGDIFRGAERLVEADWCAVTGKIEGEPVTVAMFGHPDNRRHLATWFTMPKSFAYLSATLNLHEKKLTITQDEPLDVRYGIALWDHGVGAETVDDCYRTWLETAGGAE